MKILHVNINYFGSPSLHGGMVEHLTKIGIHNTVMVPTDYKICYDNTKAYADVIIVKCFSRFDRLIFDYKQYKIKKALESSVDVSEFDCLHAHTLFSDGNCVRNISKKYNIPYIVAVRNTDVNTFFKYAFYLRERGIKIMWDAAAVVFLSKSYRDYVINNYVPDRFKNDILSKSVIIPNGIDDFWFANKYKRLNYDNGKLLKIVYAGEITKNKNITAIQKAIHVLRERGYEAQLNVVGNIVDESEYKIISKDIYTTYTSRVPKEELMVKYRENDIFVMPSFTESFGLVYAEAMSQGLPVLYTKGQGFDEQFAEGDVGFRVDPYSAPDIADKIELVLKDYDSISKRCIDMVDTFAWDKIAEEYAGLYNQVCVDASANC